MAKTQNISGRVVAITGGGRGIGRATAAALLRRGVRVAIGDIDVALAEQTAKELGSGCVALPLDVTDRASFDAFLDNTEEKLGPVDVLINNAGIMPTVRFLDEDEASIRRQFDINVFGVIHGMQAALPRMLARRTGHIVNVASTAGKFTMPGIVNYSATKHAVVGLTGALRVELRDTPIALSLVMPVIVRTELTDGMADMRGVKPLQPEDVADSIVEALETQRFEVWCPKKINAMYRGSNLLPLKINDIASRITKTDQSLLNSIDSPERRAYADRIAAPTPIRQIEPGDDAA